MLLGPSLAAVTASIRSSTSIAGNEEGGISGSQEKTGGRRQEAGGRREEGGDRAGREVTLGGQL